jgi:hypothetical protein
MLFVVELSSKPIKSGPGIVFSSLIPDMDHFKGSEGGRALPMLRPDGSANLALWMIFTPTSGRSNGSRSWSNC